MSRTVKSTRNITYALVGQTLNMLISFVARMVFVTYLSAEYLGVNGLFASILSVLSLAELGVGGAIVYALYKPLAENDTEKVKSLMALYKRAYSAIGCIVFIIGMLLTPFLGFFIAEIPDIPYIHLIYVMFVVNSALSYFFIYKRSLIVADQKKYIATIYRSTEFFFLNAAQILVLILTQSYILFLFLQIMSTLLVNILISRKADRIYPYLQDKDVLPLQKEEKRSIFKNLGALTAHRIGTAVVYGTSNLLLAWFAGIIIVGLYSNYLLIIAALNILYGTLAENIKASMGNLGVTEGKDKNHSIFNTWNFAMFWLHGFSAICLYILFNPFIQLWLGEGFLFDKVIVGIIAVTFYIEGMRRSVLTYYNALGLFWFDRYKPLVNAVFHLGISIFLGMRFGAVGIFVALPITLLATCFWVEAYVLYKHGFHKSVKPYFVRCALYTAVCAMAGVATWFVVSLVAVGGIFGFILIAVICLTVPNAIFLAVFHRTKEFRYLYATGKGLVRKGMKRLVR